jgi:coproporphyrinogen III oxidase-like Fe-S oxidoreductase
MLKGVSIDEYPVDPQLYKKLYDKGWVEFDNKIVKLSSQGLLFYDSVAEEIMYLE